MRIYWLAHTAMTPQLISGQMAVKTPDWKCVPGY